MPDLPVCVITAISWERVGVTLTVELTGSVATAKPTSAPDSSLPPLDGVEQSVPVTDEAAESIPEVVEPPAPAEEMLDVHALGLEPEEGSDDDVPPGEAEPTPKEMGESTDDPVAADQQGDGESETLIADDVLDFAIGATFQLVSGKRRFAIPTTQVGPGRYELSLNVTQFRGRRHITDGTWRFQPMLGKVKGPAATFDLRRIDYLDDSSRVFLYENNNTCYTVSFGIAEDESKPHLLMRTYQTFRRTARPDWKGRQVKRLRKKKTELANRWYRASRKANPPNGRRVLFASEMRPALAGNLLRVRDRMVERGLDKEYELEYFFRTPDQVTPRGTLRLIYLLATSDVVLIDDYVGLLESLKLAKGTRIIQVWHAGSGFKAIGFSRFGRYGSPRLGNAHRKYTYAIAGSTHLAGVYAEAFGIEQSAVIPTGLPRLDAFLDPERIERITSEFGQDYPELMSKRRILFAPTFRGRGVKDAFYDFSKVDFEALHEFCGDDTVVMFRMHHFIKEAVPIPSEFSDRLLDFTKYPDGNDLLHMTDVLITDYSSIIYEYSLLERPMVFFAYDKLGYAATRGFHRDYDSTAPGPICETFEDLLATLRSGDFHTERAEIFREENFDVVDRNSSDRVIDWLVMGDPPSPGADSPSPVADSPSPVGDTSPVTVTTRVSS